jgi:hypothetical protein
MALACILSGCVLATSLAQQCGQAMLTRPVSGLVLWVWHGVQFWDLCAAVSACGVVALVLKAGLCFCVDLVAQAAQLGALCWHVDGWG